MEVVLNSDIARLVLGYLRDQNLHNVSAKYCKYSPYLAEENEIVKKGLLPVCIKKSSLVDIVREYCIIESKVTKMVETFPVNIREAFRKQNLAGKITYLLKFAKKNISLSESTPGKSDTNKNSKRRRSQNESDSSRSSLETSRVKYLPGHCLSTTKKRKVSGSFWYLHDALSEESEESYTQEILMDKSVDKNKSIINNNNVVNARNIEIQPTSSAHQQQQQQQPYIIFNQNTNMQPQQQQPFLPETPQPKGSIILRSGQPSTSGNQNISQITGTTSFSDPNFSISKLIIMNPNETDPLIANTSNFQGLSPYNGEQVFIDLGTGQTYPLIMSNDSLNCMFLNRSEITEQANHQQDFSQQPPPVLLSNSNLETPNISENVNNSHGDFLKQDNAEQSKIADLIYEKPVYASLDSKLLNTQKETPEGNPIITLPNIRSLTTPSRKSSHVRALSFTPLPKNPENTSPSQLLQTVQSQQKALVIESKQIMPENSPKIFEKNVDSNLTNEEIKTQEKDLIPQTKLSTILENDHSNSNSTDLTGGEQSNITVIPRVKDNNETPRRKTDIRSCKRMLSRSNSEDGGDKKTTRLETPAKKIKKISAKCKKESNEVLKKASEKEPVDALEAWRQMRLKTTSTNFDQHLREITAKTPIIVQKFSKRRKRRKIGGKKNKVNDESISNLEDDDSPACSVTEESVDKNLAKKVTKQETKTLLNFKIKTPIKTTDTKTKTITQKKNKTPKKVTTNTKSKTMDDKECNTIVQEIIIEEKLTNVDLNIEKNEVDLSVTKISKEMEKRTANIAYLLETPFKVDGLQFPITPRFIQSECTETPETKLSLLPFSTKHLDIKTPAFAITPGCGFTTIEKDTPKSGCLSGIQTDYSSGGSYYRPDESEDLDKMLERNIQADLKKRRSEVRKTIGHTIETSTKTSTKEIAVKNQNIEIAQEEVPTILPCTIVLEKLKSFNDEIPNVNPHYKFSNELPEDYEATNLSSKSSSSSSSSSSDSSSSSSSSCSASTKTNSRKSLLSNINSSEDEEWNSQSADTVKQLEGENSKLMGCDGEVRFPVRSWITPKKLNEPPIPSIKSPIKPLGKSIKIPNNSMMHIYDEQSKLKSDLEQKRLRMKEQLAKDFKTTTKQKKPPTNKISPMNNQIGKKQTKIKENSFDRAESKQIEVLTALNLSAKKKPREEKQLILPDLDDNATSDVFLLRMENDDSQQSTAESLKVRNAALALTTMSLQKNKKLTVQIEALPIKPMKLRGRPCKKDKDEKSTNLQIKKNSPTKLRKINLTSAQKNLGDLGKKKVLQDLKGNKKIATAKKNKISQVNKMNNNETVKKESKNDKFFNAQPSTSAAALVQSCAPPIQSSEIRSSVEEHSTETEVKKMKEQILFTKKSEEETAQVSSATGHINNEEIKTTNEFGNNNMDEEMSEEDEDPYDQCEIVPSEKEIVKSIIYSEETSSPSSVKSLKVFNLMNSTMNIRLDGELHKLKCTNELLLFSMEPKVRTNTKSPIRNRTKKESKRLKIVAKNRERNSKIIPHELLNESPQKTNSCPQSTSTPLQPKIRISHNNKYFQGVPETTIQSKKLEIENNNQCASKNTKELKSSEVSSSSTKLSKAIDSSDSNVKKQTNISKNIRNEDIFAVLSHLHGSQEE